MSKRYISALCILGLSVFTAVMLSGIAEQMRGYKAFGGEWLVIALGLVVGLIITDKK